MREESLKARTGSPAADRSSKPPGADQLSRRCGVLVVGKPGKSEDNVPMFVKIDGIFDTQRVYCWIDDATAAAADDDDDELFVYSIS